MALIDKASLLMVPSTYEAGKLYNVLPSGNRAPDSTDQNSGYDQTRADFDFDRGSNAAATRVNADGLIEKYRENLLLHSGNLTESEWQNVRTTDTSGHTGYDGTANAYKIIPTTATNTHRIDYVDTWTTGLVYAFSFYAKSDGYDTIDVVIGGSSIGNDYGRFNLSTGTASNVGTSIAASMQDVGNGWYRCQTTQVSGSTTRINIAVNDGTTQSYAGDGTSGVLIQHPQLESGLVATDYLESTSVTGKAGVLVDLPRINYDANGENGALLLEPSRANLVTQSEYFGAGWSLLSGGSFAFNQTTSPEGVQNASTLSGDGVNANAAYFSASVTSGTAYAFSIYAKQNGQSLLRMRGFSPAAGGNVIFDLSDGTINTQPSDDFSNAKIEAVGTDGWYRCSVIATADATNSGALFGFDYSDSSASGGLFYVWGAQMEAGSYPSSYIPNNGESGGITRAADSITADGTGLTSTTKGSIFVDFNRGVTSATTRDASNDGLYFRSDNFPGTDSFEIATDTDGSVRFAKRVNSSFFGFYTDNSTDRYKCVFKWNAGAVKFYVNGTQEYTSGSGFSITNVLDEIGYAPDFKKSVTQIALFDEEITDAEAIALTTL